VVVAFGFGFVEVQMFVVVQIVPTKVRFSVVIVPLFRINIMLVIGLKIEFSDQLMIFKYG